MLAILGGEIVAVLCDDCCSRWGECLLSWVGRVLGVLDREGVCCSTHLPLCKVAEPEVFEVTLSTLIAGKIELVIFGI